jgi:23S rRNA U2552 (ribose-2'-O)-methylase RlmE/FtsJ
MTNYNTQMIVPYNLWYDDPKYTVQYITQNNQILRIRKYDNKLLTLIKIKGYDHAINDINHLPAYQAIYPERFYYFWELLHSCPHNNKKSFLHIGIIESLGTLEALNVQNERIYIDHAECVYDYWNIEKSKHPVIIDKIYHIENRLNEYDFISVDVIKKMNKPREWKNEEDDLSSVLYYVHQGIQHLKHNGTMIIHIRLLMRESWRILLDLCSKHFSSFYFYRSKILHEQDPSVYFCLDGFISKKSTYDYLPMYHQYKLYQFDKYKENETNNTLYHSMLKQFSNIIKKWMYDRDHVQKYSLSLWYKENSLSSIGDLPDINVPKTMSFKLSINAQPIKIKPGTNNNLLKSNIYIGSLKMRSKLNFCKRILDSQPSTLYADAKPNFNVDITLWENVINKTDHTNSVRKTIKNNMGGEMVTNAWLKMYEMLSYFPQINISKTFHLCEAPGAFVAATNHFLKTKNIKFDWYAQTLGINDNQDALEDHFGLINKYSDKWFYEDITKSDTIKKYMDLLKNINFMTADAGIRCDPREINEQEKIMSKAFMGEILCILGCLEKEGSAIVKIFLPMNKPLTISLINILTSVFSEIHFIKPHSSHDYNSEIYIVLVQYKGIDTTVLETLLSMLDDDSITCDSVLCSKINNEFLVEYMTIINTLMRQQINSLNYYYKILYDREQRYDKNRNDWFQNNAIKSLNSNDKLI